MNRPDQPTPGLRERVAELRGYTNIHKYDRFREGPSRSEGSLVGDLGDRKNCHIPDYPGDLNHAHAAVRALITTREQWRDFLGHLEDITKAKEFDDWVDCLKCAIFATPEQVCTALLRTLGGEEGV